ncbi:hypothetical protein FA15DRAFT_705700 [Coprinopsis marcescibilis]|uniref:Cleavage/polyadenylation specificity factor A subunit N-terminal domain-containing protein n=1 Tax=Coprinopsis marcescibilis TaxID=230819 RepID=A0A5C3KS99_COPMA|nr:hypothetical protein FA15DRAFT_705700 [Coprinopsis marcescibilis]
MDEELSNLSLADLKGIAQRTLLLNRNWALPVPKVAGPVRVTNLGQNDLDTLCQVPGSRFYLFNSPSNGTVGCWDAERGVWACSPVQVAEDIFDATAGRAERGRFSVGLLAKNRPHRLLVIVTLQYGEGVVSLSVDFKQDLSFASPGLHTMTVFWSKEVIGCLATDYFVHPICILAINIKSGKYVFINTDLIAEDLTVMWGAVLSENKLVLVAEEDGTTAVYHLPDSVLPTDRNVADIPSQTTVTLEPTYEVKQAQDATSIAILSNGTHYGVPLVSISSFRDNMAYGSVRVRFWTTSTISETCAIADNPLEAVESSIKVQGRIPSPGEANFVWHPMILSFSSRALATVLDCGGGEYVISLIRFDPSHPTKCTSHLLEIPPSINLAMFRHIIDVDDHRGIVALLDMDSNLHEIPYV